LKRLGIIGVHHYNELSKSYSFLLPLKCKPNDEIPSNVSIDLSIVMKEMSYQHDSTFSWFSCQLESLSLITHFIPKVPRLISWFEPFCLADIFSNLPLS
jgi:hypothetical protein